jgi:hypothetical protein
MKIATSALAAGIGLTFTVACATTGTGAALEPRYVAVHNALAAMGLAQIGPIHEGSLLQGHETRVAVDLPAGCTTVVTIGGDGVSDVDARLDDPHGRPIAHDTTTEPQAVLRACVDVADTYTLAVKMVSGAGTWVAGTWAGGAGPSAPPTTAGPATAATPLGTCAAPIPLAAGTFNGTTARGESMATNTCVASGEAPELVYELDVAERERVTLDVKAGFDAVLYVRKGDCMDENTEVACNDDYSDHNHSRLEEILEPGKYFVFVDGNGKERGGFALTVTVSDALALADRCRRAQPLASGAIVAASSEAFSDTTGASCGNGALGPDVPWRVNLASPSRVRVIEHSDEFSPIVHLRQACAYPDSEIACGENTRDTDAVVTRVLGPGTYTVFADSRGTDARGAYTLALDTGPVAGEGTAGDTCDDAIQVPLRVIPGGAASSVAVSGDTFPARDDVAGTCGGKGAADVVYRLDVDRRSHLSAGLSSEDAPHLLVASRGCGARATEVACGRSFETVVDPGTYFIAVDGLRPDAFGRFRLELAALDASGQAAACASAPSLVPGVNGGNLKGAPDNFGTSCGGGAFGGGGADRVYKLTIASRTNVELSLNTPGTEAMLALRKSCADGPGGVEASEIACMSGSVIVQTLEPGTYWVVINSDPDNPVAHYDIKYRILTDMAQADDSVGMGFAPPMRSFP